MSGLIVYHPPAVDERISSFMSSEIHSGDMITSLLSKNVNDKSDWDVKLIMIPNDTRVYNRYSKQSLTQKDLIINTENCSPGYTKLRSVDSGCWLNGLDEDNCLKQLYDKSGFSKMQLAFQCEWPEASLEWFSRIRTRAWPKQEVVDEIKGIGCHVIPKCSPTCTCPSAEWKFTFHKAESVLDKHAVSADQLNCLIIVKIVIDSIMGSMITVKQLKHVLYLVCEDTEVDKWQTELAECVWSFLDRLKECIRCKHIPNYFMPAINLLDDGVDDDYISRCLDCIDMVQKHPFVTLFFLCDANSFFHVELKMLFDSLIEDSRRYVLAGDLDVSISQCFIPVVAEGVSAAMVRLNNYMEALEKCQEATEHLNMLFKEKKFHLEDVISKVINVSYRDLDKWMFAFVADQKLGTFFIETVCAGLETDSMFNYFGQFLTNTLRMLTPDILIPIDLVSDRNLPETTYYMLEILEQICPKPVYQELAVFLLKEKVSHMVQNVSQFPLASKFVPKIIAKIKANLPTIPKQLRI